MARNFEMGPLKTALNVASEHEGDLFESRIARDTKNPLRSDLFGHCFDGLFYITLRNASPIGGSYDGKPKCMTSLSKTAPRLERCSRVLNYVQAKRGAESNFSEKGSATPSKPLKTYIPELEMDNLWFAQDCYQ